MFNMDLCFLIIQPDVVRLENFETDFIQHQLNVFYFFINLFSIFIILMLSFFDIIFEVDGRNSASSSGQIAFVYFCFFRELNDWFMWRFHFNGVNAIKIIQKFNKHSIWIIFYYFKIVGTRKGSFPSPNNKSANLIHIDSMFIQTSRQCRPPPAHWESLQNQTENEIGNEAGECGVPSDLESWNPMNNIV